MIRIRVKIRVGVRLLITWRGPTSVLASPIAAKQTAGSSR